MYVVVLMCFVQELLDTFLRKGTTIGQAQRKKKNNLKGNYKKVFCLFHQTISPVLLDTA
jgi:hypothetical protein